MAKQRSKISERLIGMGDSHLDNFSFFCAATCRIPGATSYGLMNDNSDTRAREAFKGFLSAFPNYIPLLCLGEVDCNSLPWRRSMKGSPIHSVYSSIDNLYFFLREIDRKFILPSVILPPVDSYKGLGVRSHVTSDKEERTFLVHLYNRLLKEMSAKQGHHYLDITTQTMNKSGLVNSEYIISKSDVHLDPSKLYPIVRLQLDGVSYV
jgi:hypothetical protein